MSGTNSGIMSMFSNMFGGRAPTPTPAPTTQPTPPGNIQQGAAATGTQNPGTAPNGAVPPSSTDTTAVEKPPLEQFTELWKNDPNAPAPTNPSVFGEVDPKKFLEAASKIDFSKSMNPELLQKVAGGGEEAMKAMAQMMNSVAQNVYAQAAFASTKITEQALAKAREQFVAEIPQHIRSQSASETLRAENPIFSHPAAAPILSALQQQIAVKFPQATSAELATMSKQFLTDFASSFSPQPSKQDAKGGAGKKEETDWSTYLNP